MTDIKGRGSLREAFQDFEKADAYWSYPLSVRSRFQRVAAWWPNRDASFRLAQVNANFAKTQRDRAALAQGWRAGNFALVLLQALVAEAVEAGVLTNNRVKQVPKLLPPRLPSRTDRRRIPAVREPIYSSTDLSKRENSSA